MIKTELARVFLAAFLAMVFALCNQGIGEDGSQQSTQGDLQELENVLHSHISTPVSNLQEDEDEDKEAEKDEDEKAKPKTDKKKKAKKSVKGTNIGDTIRPISGKDLDGVSFSLDDYQGKVIFLDFWGDW